MFQDDWNGFGSTHFRTPNEYVVCIVGHFSLFQSHKIAHVTQKSGKKDMYVCHEKKHREREWVALIPWNLVRCNLIQDKIIGRYRVKSGFLFIFFWRQVLTILFDMSDRNRCIAAGMMITTSQTHYALARTNQRTLGYGFFPNHNHNQRNACMNERTNERMVLVQWAHAIVTNQMYIRRAKHT